MKRIYFSIVGSFFFLLANAQKSDKNPFDSLNHWGNQKPILFYVFASWCGETLENYPTIADTLEKYRERFNLVILIDTFSNHFKSIQKKQLLYNSDKVIDLVNYYPYSLKKLSELKKLTLHFNTKFGSDLYRIGPSSMLLVNSQNIFEQQFGSAKEVGEYFQVHSREF